LTNFAAIEPHQNYTIPFIILAMLRRGTELQDIAPRHHSYLLVEEVANRLQRCVRFGRPGIRTIDLHKRNCQFNTTALTVMVRVWDCKA